MKHAVGTWRWSLATSVGTSFIVCVTLAVGSMLTTGRAVAQSPSNAQIDAGEPRADTSSPSSVGSANSTSPASNGGGGRATAGAGGAAAVAAGGTAVASSGTTATAANAHSTARQPVARAAGAKGPSGADHVDLGMATVTGDREQPKVMYIVPWKQSDIGNQSGKPMNSLLDEALTPVDRDEFKREVVYYDAVKAPQNGASNTSSKQGEK